MDKGKPIQIDANVAGILAILGGSLGVHDFTCGNPKSGVIKVLFAMTGFLAPVSFILSMIDLYKIGCGTYITRTGAPIEAAPWCKTAAIITTILGTGILVLGCLGYITLRTRFR